MDIQTLEIVQTANRLVDTLGTRDPHRIAGDLGIKNDLHPVMENIVMLHEIGHDVLHRKEAVKAGGFKEFNIFDMRESRMEYEANIFTAQVSLADDEILEYISQGYDVQQIARAMYSDINLVALKADALMLQGYNLRPQEYRKEFLK